MEALAGWLSKSPDRIETLRDLVDSEGGPVSTNAADALRGLTTEDAAVFEEFAHYLERVGDSSQLR